MIRVPQMEGASSVDETPVSTPSTPVVPNGFVEASVGLAEWGTSLLWFKTDSKPELPHFYGYIWLRDGAPQL